MINNTLCSTISDGKSHDTAASQGSTLVLVLRVTVLVLVLILPLLSGSHHCTWLLKTKA